MFFSDWNDEKEDDGWGGIMSSHFRKGLEEFDGQSVQKEDNLPPRGNTGAQDPRKPVVNKPSGTVRASRLKPLRTSR